MYGVITDEELKLIDEEREAEDSLDWWSPNYEERWGDRYEEDEDDQNE